MVKLNEVLIDVAFLPLIIVMYIALGAALLVYPDLLDEADGNSTEEADWYL